VVLCNCSPPESATLAKALVLEGVAACVNVIPGVTSFYLWNGALQEDVEDTLLIKVAEIGLAALSKRLQALHSYDVPEIVVLRVDNEKSHTAYVEWVRSAVQ
jgi:periplasmic divalent cation tolerance protein